MVARGVALIASQWSWEIAGRLSHEPPPCLYDTVIQSYVQLKAFNWKDGPFHGPVLHHWKSMGNFVPSCPPGVQLLPHFEVWSYRACQLFKCGKFHISVKSTLWAMRRQFFFAMLSQWGKFGTLLPPGVLLLPHFEVWSYRACQPEMWQISHFCEIHFLSYEAASSFLNVKSMRLILPLFCPGANIVPPIAYKSHSNTIPD